MKLQLLALASALAFSHLVVAGPTQTANASSSQATMIIEGKYEWALVFDHWVDQCNLFLFEAFMQLIPNC